MALIDSPQIIFRENLGPKKAEASSHMMSTFTLLQTVGQDKTAAKTLHGLPMRDATTDPNLGFHLFCASNKDDHACFKLDDNSVTAKKVIWSFALPSCLGFFCLTFTGNAVCVLL